MLRSAEGAEDAAQDALVAALSNLDRFRGDAQLGTWLYRVGANAVLMTMRRDRRTADRTVRATAQLPQESCWLHGSSSSPQPQYQLESAQRAQLLRWAVEQLPERYRAVVMQCDLDERPIEEVASALGISIGGVRTRRLRAHRMIKDALQRSKAGSAEP